MNLFHYKIIASEYSCLNLDGSNTSPIPFSEIQPGGIVDIYGGELTHLSDAFQGKYCFRGRIFNGGHTTFK